MPVSIETCPPRLRSSFNHTSYAPWRNAGTSLLNRQPHINFIRPPLTCASPSYWSPAGTTLDTHPFRAGPPSTDLQAMPELCLRAGPNDFSRDAPFPPARERLAETRERKELRARSIAVATAKRIALPPHLCRAAAAEHGQAKHLPRRIRRRQNLKAQGITHVCNMVRDKTPPPSTPKPASCLFKPLCLFLPPHLLPFGREMQSVAEEKGGAA